MQIICLLPNNEIFVTMRWERGLGYFSWNLRCKLRALAFTRVRAQYVGTGRTACDSCVLRIAGALNTE